MFMVIKLIFLRLNWSKSDIGVAHGGRGRVINYNGFEAFDILLSPVESNALGAGVSGVSALTEYDGLNFNLS